MGGVEYRRTRDTCLYRFLEWVCYPPRQELVAVSSVSEGSHLCDPYSSRRRRGSVEKTCTNCGKVLPRDDARFCNNCGQIIPYSRPLKHSLPDEPPAWMKQLEDSISHATPSGKLKIHVSDTSTSSASNHTQSSIISEALETKPTPEDPKPSHPQETSSYDDISVDNAEADISPP